MAPGQDEGPSQEASSPDIQQTPGGPPVHDQKFDQQQTHANPAGRKTCTRSNPCCCQLRIGVLVIGVYGIVHFASMTISAVVGLAIGTKKSKEIPIVDICILIMYIISLGLAIVLTVAAAKKSARLVQISFFAYIVMFFLELIRITLSAVFPPDVVATYSKWIIISAAILQFIIITVVFLYLFFVIWSYLKQLTRIGQQVDGEPGGVGQFPVGPPRPTPQANTGQFPQPKSGGFPRPISAQQSESSNQQ